MFNYQKNESKDRQGSLKRMFLLVYLTYVKKKKQGTNLVKLTKN